MQHIKPTRGQLGTVVTAAIVFALIIKPRTLNSYFEIIAETLFVGLFTLIAFNAAGAWRQHWLPTWVAQVVAVSVGALISPLIVQLITAHGDISAFLGSRHHVNGYWLITGNAIIVGSLFALGALYRQRDAQARAQALQFALEREILERQAADAKLHLLTAQIEPHFLLNTLANVQELIESGSPRAVPVFRSLIAYLRAALPQLAHEQATLGDEANLVQAYLELMHLRMPDRLSWTLEIPTALRGIRFPSMALLTLVENAVHHGIDPAIDGGQINVGATREATGQLQLWVEDTGVGMSCNAGQGLGLSNLQLRLKAFFGPQARLEMREVAPHGLRADILVDPHG